jgi:hypothetical protein
MCGDRRGVTSRGANVYPLSAGTTAGRGAYAMKKNRPLVTHVLAALALVVALALLIAGCKPAIPPEAFVEREKCIKCLGRSCASETTACETDPAPSSHGDGNRCMCLFGCRIQHHSVASCLDHCGPMDATYDPLRSCIDTNCNDRCPRNEEP